MEKKEEVKLGWYLFANGKFSQDANAYPKPVGVVSSVDPIHISWLFQGIGEWAEKNSTPQVGWYAFEGKKFSSNPKEFPGLLGIVVESDGKHGWYLAIKDIAKMFKQVPSSKEFIRLFKSCEIKEALVRLQQEMPELFPEKELSDDPSSLSSDDWSTLDKWGVGLKRPNLLDF